MKTKALFLDRDGIINIEKEYLYKIDAFEFINGIFETLYYAQTKGYLLIVITNQSGIGRGYYSEKDFLSLNQWMCEQFEKNGINISKVYYCPHKPDELCNCRKPMPGMLQQASKEFGIDFDNSIIIGDKESDIKAGKAVGIKKCILARSGHHIAESSTEADFVIDSVKELISYL